MTGGIRQRESPRAEETARAETLRRNRLSNVPEQRLFCHPGDIWPGLETFLASDWSGGRCCD